MLGLKCNSNEFSDVFSDWVRLTLFSISIPNVCFKHTIVSGSHNNLTDPY